MSLTLSPVEDLPEGWTMLGHVSVVKCWDQDGEVKFVARYSQGINEAEKRGMFDIGLEWLADDEVVSHLSIDIRDEDDDDGL